jgi:hypothetical protein
MPDGRPHLQGGVVVTDLLDQQDKLVSKAFTLC